MKITRLLSVFAFLFVTNFLAAQYTATISSFPYQEGFENGLGDYFNFNKVKVDVNILPLSMNYIVLSGNDYNISRPFLVSRK